MNFYFYYLKGKKFTPTSFTKYLNISLYCLKKKLKQYILTHRELNKEYTVSYSNYK